MTDFLPGIDEALRIARTGAEGHRDDRPCVMCIVIQHTAPGEPREALVAAAAGRISGRALHQSLRQIGIGVSRESILNHRNEAHQP